MNTNTIVNFNLPFANTVDQNFQKEMQYINQCKDGILFEGSRIAVAKPKVSIVIPVYNKVKYLDLALRSAQNQTMRDLEIICVDDGSNDGSIEKIKSYIEQDERISLIKHEKNEGTLKARCDGVRAAKGEFIMQLDPDDAFCNPKIAELAYKKAKEVGADIVQFKVLGGYSDGSLNLIKWASPTIFMAIDNPEMFNLFLKNKFECMVWGKIINRNLYLKSFDALGEEYISKGIVANEDFPQSFMCFKLANRYVAIESIGYLYYKNEDGIAFRPFEIDNGKLVRPGPANKRIKSWGLHFDRLYELIDNEHKDGFFCTFLRMFNFATIKVIQLSDYSEKIREILEKGLNCEYVADGNKDRMKNFLLQLEQELKKNKK